MSESNIPYVFRLKIKDTEIEVGGDRIFVETQLEKWLPLFGSDIPESLRFQESSDISASKYHAPTSRQVPTVVDFIKTKQPKALPDFVLVVGLYLERFQQKDLFTHSDLMHAIFERANKSTEEVQEALDSLVTHQFLRKMETMGTSEPSYSLTFTGEQAVKDGFES